LAEAILDNAALKDLLEKMVPPVAWREAVAHLGGSFAMSERRACRVIVADRSSVRYRRRRPDDGLLQERLKALAHQRPAVWRSAPLCAFRSDVSWTPKMRQLAKVEPCP
jgi:putative transposase